MPPVPYVGRMNQLARRTIFSFARKPIWHLPSSSAVPIPQHELVDEEICPEYNARYFYSAKPGDILACHYQLLVKIGWGTRSTVWLARDITRYAQPFHAATAFHLMK